MRLSTWWVAWDGPKIGAFVVIWWAMIDCVEWCTPLPVPGCNKVHIALVATAAFKVLEATIGRSTERHTTVVSAGGFSGIADLTNPGF